MATFGSRLRELLDGSDIQYKDFAKLLKVAPSTISNWLNGDRFPNDEKIITFIADYFKVTLDYLLGRTNNSNVEIKEFEVNGSKYKIGLNKNDNNSKMPFDLTADQVKELIDNLGVAGFDVNRLIDKIKNK